MGNMGDIGAKCEAEGLAGKTEEVRERWRNWGNVLLRVRALPDHAAVCVGVAAEQVADVVGFVYGADGDVAHLLAEIDRLKALFQQTHGVHVDWVAEGRRLKGEVERLTSLLEAERQDRGIWGDGCRDDLAVWYDGGEKVVASDADEALEVWAAHNGVAACTHESLPDVPFERVPDDQEISICLGEDGAPPKAKLPAKVWALIHGRGWLCSENI